jgi:hypothetical protein
VRPGHTSEDARVVSAVLPFPARPAAGSAFRLCKIIGSLACIAAAGCSRPHLPPLVERPKPDVSCGVARGATRVASVARRSPFLGPRKPTALWIHEVPGAPRMLDLAVDINGIADVSATFNDGVVGLARDGSVRWTRKVNIEPATSAVVGSDGALYPGCHRNTMAIVSSSGAEFPWVDSSLAGDASVEAIAAREEFRRGALRAAGPIRWHGSGFGMACVERVAFAVFVLPGEDVHAAAKRIGEWLVSEGLHGEIDIIVEPMPTLL